MAASIVHIGPSCPACGYKDSVEVTRWGSYYCGPCNLIFSGSDAEWDRGWYGGEPLRKWRANRGRRPAPDEGGAM